MAGQYFKCVELENFLMGVGGSSNFNNHRQQIFCAVKDPVDVAQVRCVKHQWTTAQLAGDLTILDAQAHNAPVIGGGEAIIAG